MFLGRLHEGQENEWWLRGASLTGTISLFLVHPVNHYTTLMCKHQPSSLSKPSQKTISGGWKIVQHRVERRTGRFRRTLKIHSKVDMVRVRSISAVPSCHWQFFPRVATILAFFPCAFGNNSQYMVYSEDFPRPLVQTSRSELAGTSRKRRQCECVFWSL